MNKKRYLNCKYLDVGMDGMLCGRTPFRTCLEFHGDLCPYYQAKKPSPPKAGTTPSPKSQTPSYTPPPMPEVKAPKAEAVPLEVSRTTYELLSAKGLLNPNILYVIKEPCSKQRTVLSVRDFVILYEIASRELGEVEKKILCMGVDREETKYYPYYQDLLRIREKLGELNIEVDTPIVEVEE